MERSSHYNMHASRSSRARLKVNDPNLSMRSGTYQIHRSIPRSMKANGTLYVQANNVFTERPQTVVETNGVPLQLHKLRSRSMSPGGHAIREVTYEPMPRSPRYVQAANGTARISRSNGAMSSRSNGAMSPRSNGAMSPIPNGAMSPRSNGAMSPIPNGAISPRSNGTMSPKSNGGMSPSSATLETGFFFGSKTILPGQDTILNDENDDHIPKSLQLFQDGNEISTKKPQNNGTKAHDNDVQTTVIRSKSSHYVQNGVRHNARSIHYEQKESGRKSAPVSRTMSLNTGTKTSKSYISIRSLRKTKSPRKENDPRSSQVKTLDTSTTSSKSQIDESLNSTRSSNGHFTMKSTMDTSMTSVTGLNPNLYDIYAEMCRQKGVLFEDPDFPAGDESLFTSARPTSEQIQWLRPKEITSHPTFTEHGMRFTVRQGTLGPSWLVGAFSCLSQTPSLLQQCIPEGQGFGKNYVGMFRFRFWKFGQWTEVIVDDRLPVVNGELIYLHCQNSRDFWVALFEKAYAKLYGGYEHILGARIGWALQDITGGVTHGFSVTNTNSPILQKALSVSITKPTLMGASISTTLSGGQKRHLQNGLITGHVYSVTGYAEVTLSGKPLVLLRLRNCWGRTEWRGPWCPGSENWKVLNDEAKEKVRKTKMEEGEFWMSLGDFQNNFSLLEMCYLTPEAWNKEPKIQHRERWIAAQGYRQWRHGYNAGGGPNSPLVSYNCQFYLELSQPSCVIVSLMQRYRWTATSDSFHPCTCLIYHTTPGLDNRLGYSDFNQTKLIASTPFHDGRENTGFFHLAAGAYIILPVTDKSGMEGKFFLRILTDCQSRVRELDDKDLLIPVDPNRMHDGANLLSFKRKFLYAINQDDELDALGLQHVLDHKHGELYKLWCCQSDVEGFEFKPLKLSLETCKSAITIVDHGVKGKLNYEEFNNLLSLLVYWQEVFHKLTRGGVSLETYSLRVALRMTGFLVSNKTLEALVIRFSSKATMDLEAFINTLVKLTIAHQRSEIKKHENERERGVFLQELLRAAIYS